MTTEGSTENESRYRNLIESIIRERLLFKNPGRFGPSKKSFRHHDEIKTGKVRIVKVKNWNGEIIIYCRV